MKILLFANTDWYLYNFRLSLAAHLKDLGHQVVLLSPSGEYGAKLSQMGYDWHPLPMARRSLNPFRELSLLFWLIRFFQKQRPDLIHGFTIKSAVYGLIAARLAGVSARVGSVAGMGYVFTSNDLLARLLRPVVRVAFRLAFGGADARLIVQNPDDFALIRSANLIKSDQLSLVPGSGVDCTRFSPGAAAQIQNAIESKSASAPSVEKGGSSLRVLLPARLLWDKGIGECVEAAKILKSQELQIEFFLAGDRDPGNPACIPSETIGEWVFQGLITSLGHVSDMASLYRSVDIVVLPSYREGLPKGLIEAAACALPLVTTDVPGCREVVTHEVDGLLIPVKNSQALADAIGRLAHDTDLRVALGRAARAKALEQFDQKIIIEKTLDVYRQLLPRI